MGSVVTARSLRLRLNTYSSSIQPGRNRSSAGPSCQVLAHFGCGAWRLRNIHAGFPPTIHSRGRWLRDLGGSRSSGRGTCRRGGSSRAWPLSRKSGEKGKVTPDASALFASEASAIDSGSRSPQGGDGGSLGIGLRFDGAVAGTGFQFGSAVGPPWRPGSFQKSGRLCG